MTELYDAYHEHFLRMNRPTQEAFESIAITYSGWYHKFLPADRDVKILDVGCGMGHFLYFLKKEGYTDYWGVDISAAQVQFVSENITERVTAADVFDYLEEDGSFNVIVANDVLEHIPEDKTLTFLRLIYNSLEPNGLLFVKTPNMSNPFSLGFRYADYTHSVGFTEESLRQILNVSGFQEIQIIGTSVVIRSLKSWISRLGRRATHEILRSAFKMLGYPSPNILDPHLLAICTNK